MICRSVHHSLTVWSPLQKKTGIILRVVHIWPGPGSLWSCNDLPVTITLSCDDRAVCTCPAERCSRAHSCCALLPISVSQHTCLALTHTHTHTSFTHIQTHTNGSCSLFLRSYTARHCLSVKTVLLFFLGVSHNLSEPLPHSILLDACEFTAGIMSPCFACYQHDFPEVLSKSTWVVWC